MMKERHLFMRPIGAAYGLIGSFMVIERLLRQGKEAKF